MYHLVQLVIFISTKNDFQISLSNKTLRYLMLHVQRFKKMQLAGFMQLVEST